MTGAKLLSLMIANNYYSYLVEKVVSVVEVVVVKSKRCKLACNLYNFYNNYNLQPNNHLHTPIIAPIKVSDTRL